MAVYFGFGIAPSMFPSKGVEIVPQELSDSEGAELASLSIPCLNGSHAATIKVLNTRFGVAVEVPAVPPKVVLGIGDSVVVMAAIGLPRLVDRHEYTEEEVEGAIFRFVAYHVVQASGMAAPTFNF